MKRTKELAKEYDDKCKEIEQWAVQCSHYAVPLLSKWIDGRIYSGGVEDLVDLLRRTAPHPMSWEEFPNEEALQKQIAHQYRIITKICDYAANLLRFIAAVYVEGEGYEEQLANIRYFIERYFPWMLAEAEKK